MTSNNSRIFCFWLGFLSCVYGNGDLNLHPNNCRVILSVCRLLGARDKTRQTRRLSRRDRTTSPKATPRPAHPPFGVERFTGGVVIFGAAFLSLFAALLISGDRSQSFLARLSASPYRDGINSDYDKRQPHVPPIARERVPNKIVPVRKRQHVTKHVKPAAFVILRRSRRI